MKHIFNTEHTEKDTTTTL